MQKNVLFLKEKVINQCRFAVSMDACGSLEGENTFPIFLHPVVPQGPLPPGPGPGLNAINTIFQIHY